MKHPATRAIAERTSQPSVTTEAPTRKQLRRMLRAAGNVADHKGLRPWRIVAISGDARRRLGAAMVADSAAAGKRDEGLAKKPLRAPLLLALVATHHSAKVPEWEQDATAAGVGHFLGIVLAEHGWGSMWRTGWLVEGAQTRAVHGLGDDEKLLGWLYVGGMPVKRKSQHHRVDAKRHLTWLNES